MDLKIKLLLLEEEYRQEHNDDFLLFPEFWDDSDDIKTKIEILEKALKQKKTVFEIEGCSKFVEGVF